MDWMELTDARYLYGLLSARTIMFFAAGAVYGGLLGIGLSLKQWWIPTILVLLPLVLSIVSLVVPTPPSVVYRLFFLGVPALAVIAFAVWLAR